MANFESDQSQVSKKPRFNGGRIAMKPVLTSALIITALSACNFVPPERWNLSGAQPQAQARVLQVTVLPQQSIYDVARQENVPVEALASANGLRAPYQIYIGQRLNVPSGNYDVASYGTYNQSVAATPAGTQPRQLITGAGSTGAVTGGAISSGSVASAPLEAPVGAVAAPQNASGQNPSGQPGLYGSVDVATLDGQAAGANGELPWQARQVEQNTAGLPPAPGQVEVLEARVAEPVLPAPVVAPANAPRAEGKQVASLPTPGVPDVPVDGAVAPASFEVPAPRPLHNQQTRQAVIEEPAVKPEPVEVAAAPAPVPVPDLPEDAVAPVEPVAQVEPEQVIEEPAIIAVPTSTADLAPLGDRAFGWPVEGDIISTFGAGATESANDGINIAASQGTEILASQDGFVVYAGNELAGFGNLILIRHADDWVTGYAHAHQMSVAKDEFVRAGQVIGTVGSTGSVNEPQLHFEIRKGTNAVNPADHMPPRS